MGFRSRHAGGQPVFYGWVIVGVLGYISAILIMQAALNLSLFVKPMGEALGISAILFGWSGTLRALCSALSGPFIGRLMDQYGPRYLIPVAVGIGSCAVICLGQVRETWQFLAVFAVLGFMGLMGPAQLYTIVPITKWFVRQRGRAISLVFLGAVVGPVILLPLNQLAIEQLGWSNTWTIIGAVSLVTVLPLSIIFLRRQPEDMGLLPDGAAAPPPRIQSGDGSASYTGEPADEHSWTRNEAMRTPAFWRLGFAYSFTMFAGSGFILFRIAHFVERGMDPVTVSLGASVDAAMFGVMSVTAGFLEHRISARAMGALGFSGIFLALVLAITADSVPMMLLANAMWGAGAGANNISQQLIWANYYGRGHQGSIRGLITPLTLLVGNISGPLSGTLREITGSYGLAWSIAAGLVLVGGILVATTAAPRWRESTPVPEAETIR
jgi:MFS family permease